MRNMKADTLQALRVLDADSKVVSEVTQELIRDQMIKIIIANLIRTEGYISNDVSAVFKEYYEIGEIFGITKWEIDHAHDWGIKEA